MDKSEIRIIVDVKKTITLLSSKPTTLCNIASEFSSPLKRNTYEHGIKPFNNDLDRIEITEIEAVSLVVKEDSPIFIEALQESFGEYTRSVAYPYTSPYSGSGLEESKVILIDIKKVSKNLYNENN
jgi:hypothetical protein